MPAAPATEVESQLARRSAAVSMLEGAIGQTVLTSTSALSQAVEQLTLPALVPDPSGGHMSSNDPGLPYEAQPLS